MQPGGGVGKLLDVSSTPSPKEATAMIESTSPRSYQVGDFIPGHGKVTRISDTAYLVGSIDRGGRWVPFYGRNGVDRQVAATPLISFEG